MNDQAPGNPWDSAPGASAAPEPARPPRQKRQARPAAAPKVRKARKTTAGTERLSPGSSIDNPPKKPRKAKESRPSVGPVIPMMIKCTVKEYADAVLGADAKSFVKLHGILASVAKGSRGKLLAELQKVFG